MITLLILTVGAALVVVAIYARWIDRRARRTRKHFQHVTGAKPWWGQR